MDSISTMALGSSREALLLEHARVGNAMLDYVPPDSSSLVSSLQRALNQCIAEKNTERAEKQVAEQQVAHLQHQVTHLHKQLEVHQEYTQQFDTLKATLLTEKCSTGSTVALNTLVCEVQSVRTHLLALGGDTHDLISAKTNEAVLQYQIGHLESQLRSAQAQSQELQSQLDKQKAEAQKVFHNSSLLGQALETRVHQFVMERLNGIMEISRSGCEVAEGDLVLSFTPAADNQKIRIMIECKMKQAASTKLKTERDYAKFFDDMRVANIDYGIIFGQFGLAKHAPYTLGDNHAFIANSDMDLLFYIIIQAIIRIATQRGVTTAMAHTTARGKPELQAVWSKCCDLITHLRGQHAAVQDIASNVTQSSKTYVAELESLLQALRTANDDLLPTDCVDTISVALGDKKRAAVASGKGRAKKMKV